MKFYTKIDKENNYSKLKVKWKIENCGLWEINQELYLLI